MARVWWRQRQEDVEEEEEEEQVVRGDKRKGRRGEGGREKDMRRKERIGRDRMAKVKGL